MLENLGVSSLDKIVSPGSIPLQHLFIGKPEYRRAKPGSYLFIAHCSARDCRQLITKKPRLIPNDFSENSIQSECLSVSRVPHHLISASFSLNLTVRDLLMTGWNFSALARSWTEYGGVGLIDLGQLFDMMELSSPSSGDFSLPRV